MGLVLVAYAHQRTVLVIGRTHQATTMNLIYWIPLILTPKDASANWQIRLFRAFSGNPDIVGREPILCGHLLSHALAFLKYNFILSHIAPSTV